VNRNLAAPQQLALLGERLLDFHDHFRAGENLARRLDHPRARGDIFGVGQPRADPGRSLDQHLMPMVGQFGDRTGRQPDAKLVVL